MFREYVGIFKGETEFDMESAPVCIDLSKVILFNKFDEQTSIELVTGSTMVVDCSYEDFMNHMKESISRDQDLYFNLN